MYMRNFLSCLFVFATLFSVSQTGKITGKIIDAKTGETLQKELVPILMETFL
jgi:hypothetical protein